MALSQFWLCCVLIYIVLLGCQRVLQWKEKVCLNERSRKDKNINANIVYQSILYRSIYKDFFFDNMIFGLFICTLSEVLFIIVWAILSRYFHPYKKINKRSESKQTYSWNSCRKTNTDLDFFLSMGLNIQRFTEKHNFIVYDKKQ